MIKRILLFSILLVMLGHGALSQSRGLGLGVVLGDPTGFNGKAWLSHSGAFQFGVGMPSLSQSHGTLINAEYIWHAHVIRSHEQFPLFYGIGGVLGSGWGNSAIGARGIFGMAWWPRNSSIDIFFQLTPTLYFSPDSHFEFDGGVGIRYFF